MSWIEFFNKVSLNEPGKTAIVDQSTGVRWSYRKLRLEVDRWACFFQETGIVKGDRVALLAKNRLEHVSIFFALAHLGAIFVPLNWRLSKEELQEILKRIEPEFFIYDEDHELKFDKKQIDLRIWSLPSAYKFRPVQTSKHDPLLMLFTSGSTGIPKGVLFHGEMLEANQWATVKEWGLRKEDVSIVETPFFHTGGYNVLLLPLLLIGGTLILSKGFDQKGTLELIEKEKVSIYFGVPTMFQRLSECPIFPKVNFKKVRFFISGGAPCPENLINLYQSRGVSFRQGFGMTEVGPNCFSLGEKYAISKMGSIGKPMKHTRVMVLKKNGEYAKVDEVGELLLAGPHVCLGYYKQETLFSDSKKGEFFKTGDLVKFDKDGFFYVVGRSKEMYISGGENVYPGEVEKALKEIPLIDEVAVVSVPSTEWGEVGYAFYRGEKEVDLSTVRKWLNNSLCRFKHPGYLKMVKEFPLLGSGKIDKHSLRNQALEGL